MSKDGYDDFFEQLAEKRYVKEHGSANPMNCQNCKYKQLNSDENLWCYMFKDEPKEICMQFIGVKSI